MFAQTDAFKRKQTSFGWLPRGFIIAAFVNFVVGSTLGGVLATDASVGGMLGPIHGELNPFGWLTMLIYGMTYAVLSLSAGIRPPSRLLSLLHWLTAESGVVLIVGAMICHAQSVFVLGYIVQALSPVLFLVNILMAVRAKRKRSAVDNASSESVQALSFLWKSDAYRAADRVGQRGTDIALMVYLVAAWWLAVSACRGDINFASPPLTLPYLIAFYGWIMGTVLAVATHLMPRLLQQPISAKIVCIGQGLWGLGILLLIGSAMMSSLESIAVRLLGLAIVWHGGYHLWLLLRHDHHRRQSTQLPQASRIAFLCSWSFAAMLGVLFLVYPNPSSLVALHLLFLGWTTTLAYGIGYRLFPEILGMARPIGTLALIQVAASIIGTLLMLVGFLFSQILWLAVGGSLAAAAALVFLFYWLICWRK